MNETTDAASIFAPLWRRKWLILTVAVVVAVGSYLDYKREKPTYEASTELYLGAASEEVAPGEKASKTSLSNVTNQASVINSIVVEGVRHRLRNEHKAALTRGAIVRAKSSEKGQFITIETEAHSGKAAALLANLVAQAYIARQGATRHRTVERAIAIARRQVRRIEASDAGKAGTKGPSTASILQTAALNTKINELESSLELAGAAQIKPAKGTSATLLGPEPKKTRSSAS